MSVSSRIFAILAITSAAVAPATAKDAKFLAKKSDFFKSCSLSDHNLNKCFAKNFQEILHEWRNGIPGYNSAGSLDPLHVKRVTLAQDPENRVALDAELSNIVIKGAGNMIVKEAKFNLKNLRAQFQLLSPKLSFDSDYKVKGRILNLALHGSGKAALELENLELVLNMQLKLRDEYGYTFTDIEKFDLRMGSIGGIHVNFENLFDGQKALGDSTNALFNENWREFYEVLKPAISRTVEAIMQDRVSKIFAYVPATYIIHDLPTAAEYKS